MKKQKIHTLIFYFFLIFFILLSVGLTYSNIIIEKNFKQFSADENEPSELDFYFHKAAI